MLLALAYCLYAQPAHFSEELFSCVCTHAMKKWNIQYIIEITRKLHELVSQLSIIMQLH